MIDLVRRGQSSIYGQVSVTLKGNTWTNKAGVGDTSPQTVENLDAAKTYLLINSAGANVEIDTVDTPTPVKLTGETSFDFVWASGKIALYELSAEEAALDVAVLGQKYHYVNGTKSTNSVRLRSVNSDETKESIAYVNLPPGEVLRSLPNGTKDEVNVTTGVKTQRVSNNLILNGYSGWECARVDGHVNTYRFIIWNWSTANNAVKGDINSVIAINKGRILNVFGAAPSDNEGLWVPSAHNNLYFYVLRTDVDVMEGATTTDKFKAYLNAHPIALTYQLAEPVVTQLDPQPLTIFPNGTQYIEFGTKEVAEYADGINISNAEIPIKAMKTVDKLHIEDGHWKRTAIDLANVAVSPDGLSFTIADAVNGETYEYSYDYDSALSTLPDLEVGEPSLVTRNNRTIVL